MSERIPMEMPNTKEMLQSGTGFMDNLSECMKHFEEKGYSENFTPRFDHFECQDGKFKLFPHEFVLDDVQRFENTSDPDDQTILYAISSKTSSLKGLYVESYGSYHDDFSQPMMDYIKEQCLIHNKNLKN